VSAGRLVGIARRARRLAPMQETGEGVISVAAGLAGDSKGARFPQRQVTLLAREAWAAAVAEAGNPALPWTARRANLLLEGVELPRGRGSIVQIGPVRLEVTGQTYPCSRMEEARPGLLRVLARDWRGGLTCRVLEGGAIRLGDAALVVFATPAPRLPG
jgi:MOSC domain-containing protein YiiM